MSRLGIVSKICFFFRLLHIAQGLYLILSRLPWVPVLVGLLCDEGTTTPSWSLCRKPKQSCPLVSTIDVTEKGNERLNLDAGVLEFVLVFTISSALTPPPLWRLFLNFRTFFSRVASHFFRVCQHDSPSNLDKSRYPLWPKAVRACKPQKLQHGRTPCAILALSNYFSRKICERKRCTGVHIGRQSQ